ncbi:MULTISPECIES: sodium:solute symporter [Bacillaceae]|uniref:Sodium:solute symporter n=1 Tax=Gottfriedia luciferensis TaxID=178774 RepID=A0ABX2ZRT8_9BACI|nr:MULTISPECIES: sodium:solute symporter [Bacillaceae]ODG92480.1 sodium:solute symporter [Gottfriedia luciferensis]PGZ94027.1 sodium:solute symporter [Bacillus sp. AFS029533]SFD49382.1 solute:Na+ symporter, SSS family [Bacillus sp. UNCCL81]
MSILLIGITFLIALYLGIRARRGREMNMESWVVGDRNFGSIVMFVLMAGEMFTTFIFLGASSASYSMGGPVIYIFCAVTYIIPFWILPHIWRYAKKHNLLTQPDFFVKKYNSKSLGLLVALVGVVSIVPYMVLQLNGIKIIVSEASYGAISPNLAVWIGVIVVTIFVYISGIHGSAFTAILKDILMLITILFLGIYLPFHFYGGVEPMFRTLDAAKPGFLLLPKSGYSISWYVSVCLIIALGQYMWPHVFGASLSSKDSQTLRKNAALIPLYQILMVFILFIGFTALLQMPHIPDGRTDLVLFEIAKATLPPWFIGVIGSAGLLAALVPSSLLLLTASTLLSKNIYKAIKPETSDAKLAGLTRILVPIIALIALFFTFYGGKTMLSLLLMAYSFVLQLFPALIVTFFKRNPVTKIGAVAGILSGLVTVAYVTIKNTTFGTIFPHAPQFLKDFDSGFIAFTINIVFMFGVSGITYLIKIRPRVRQETIKEQW